MGTAVAHAVERAVFRVAHNADLAASDARDYPPGELELLDRTDVVPFAHRRAP
jgi:hypothetical protein